MPARILFAVALMALLVSAAAIQAQDQPVHTQAWITPASGDTPAFLVIETEVDEGWHISSLTTPKGGPTRTKIKLKNDALVGVPEFQTTPKAKSSFNSVFNVDVEEHVGLVTFFAPLKLAEGTDLATLKLTGSVFAQACNEQNCLLPTDYKFTAVLDASKKPPKPSEE